MDGEVVLEGVTLTVAVVEGVALILAVLDELEVTEMDGVLEGDIAEVTLG